MGLSLKKKHESAEEIVNDAPQTHHSTPHAVPDAPSVPDNASAGNDPVDGTAVPSATAPKRQTGPAFYWGGGMVEAMVGFIVDTEPLPKSEDVLTFLLSKFAGNSDIGLLNLNKVRMKLSQLRAKGLEIPQLAQSRAGRKGGYDKAAIEAILAGRK